MALVLKDRVKETTTTTGTGTITLAGASAGFQAFSVIGDGNSTYYAIKSGNNWEVGVGTYTLSGTTLARTTILESSNSGSAITLAGTSDVFVTYPALESNNGIVMNNTTINKTFTFPTGRSGMSVGAVTIATGVTITVPSGQKWVVL
jgi:hypothetical protein